MGGIKRKETCVCIKWEINTGGTENSTNEF